MLWTPRSRRRWRVLHTLLQPPTTEDGTFPTYTQTTWKPLIFSQVRPFLRKLPLRLETDGIKACFPYPLCTYDIYMSIYLSIDVGIDRSIYIYHYMCKYTYEMPVNMGDSRKCGSDFHGLFKYRPLQSHCCVTAPHCGPLGGICHGKVNLAEGTAQLRRDRIRKQTQAVGNLPETNSFYRLVAPLCVFLTRKMLLGRCIGGPGMPGHARCGWS